MRLGLFLPRCAKIPTAGLDEAYRLDLLDHCDAPCSVANAQAQ